MWKVLFGILIGVVACLGYHRALEGHPYASWHLACFEAGHILPGCTGLPGPATQPPEIIKAVDPEPAPTPTNPTPTKKAGPRPAYCAYKAIRTNPTCPRIQWIRAHQRREAILVKPPTPADQR